MKKRKAASKKGYTCTLMQRHFKGYDVSDLVTSSRTFPATARVDLQKALDKFVQALPGSTLVGVHQQWGHDTLVFAKLWVNENYPTLVGPLQFEEIDLGGTYPIRCLKEALWLGKTEKKPFAVLLTPYKEYGRAEGVAIEVAVPPGKVGLQFSQDLMFNLEKAVAEGKSYRGKILSLEESRSHSGKASAIRVHKLKTVAREDVVLPQKTLALLERNVTGFIRHRAKLGELNLGLKKGLLFYGPPGTGKTHTIHYLASELPEHTTFLITAEQLGLLGEYMALARLLQPSLVVMEDVDLIARERTHMRNPCEESLLNKLLNEMDGLREDAAVFFILTTNRPDQLEQALAGRPGRIDQAIEFPLPDDAGRRKLATLYARDLSLPNAVLDFIVQRTKGVSAAFIKELMRRSAQCMLHSHHSRLQEAHINEALEELLFTGGSLNAKLLGAEAHSAANNHCG